MAKTRLTGRSTGILADIRYLCGSVDWKRDELIIHKKMILLNQPVSHRNQHARSND